ncbi:MAG: growth inhibitor PemK [Lachnospiraceae bacterium]|nr:growth inhibitor PemK [Lachnospiraceae bacterium]
MTYYQGDIVKIDGLGKHHFVITSKNAFIQALGVFHVSPLLLEYTDGPLHIPVIGKNGTKGTVICEQLKIIDPAVRAVNKTDSLKYQDIMNISDAIQGMFEYD